MNEAIEILIKDGMTREAAVEEINERCAYHMRGYEKISRRYAEELVIDEIIAWNE